jgi:Rrf2 family protein
MIKIPARIRYAIRTLVELGKENGKITPLKLIEETQNISAKFAKQIMQPLEKSDLVKSKRGVYGGYYLAREPEEISLMDVIESFKKPNNIVFCISPDESCPREPVCGAKIIWEDLQNKIDNFLTNTTIRVIMEKETDI